MKGSTALAPVAQAGPAATARTDVGALVLRDLAAAPLLRLPILLDLAFGVVNLVVFLCISRIVGSPADGLLDPRTTYFDFVAVGLTYFAILYAALGLQAFSIAVSHGETAARVVVVGLSFVSGVYFPVTILPPILRDVGTMLPTRLAVDGLRRAMAGDDWGGDTVALFAVTTLLLPASIWLFGRALTRARRQGTLCRG